MYKFFQKKITEGWMTIHSQAETISLAHVVRPQSAKPVVRILESYATNNDIPAALKLLVKKHPLAQYRCATQVGDKEYRITQAESPDVPPEELISALRWQLKDVVDFPLHDAAIDVTPIPSDPQGRKQNLFAFCASRAAIAMLMGQFSEAKIKLSAIDVPELALRNISACFALPKRGHALLLIGPTSTQFVVTYEGDLVLSRRIDLAAGQLAVATEERQVALIERMGLELQRTLDAFERQFSFISIAGLTLACAEDIDALESKLKESIYIPISRLELEEILDISAIPELKNPVWQARNLQLIGGCLRD